MSIPASVILGGDLDTVGRLRSGRLDYPWFPTKERPFAEGLMLTTEARVEVFTLEYIVPHDFELYSIAIACSEYKPEDNWSVYMGDDLPENYILKNIYTKDLPEGFQLMAVMTFFKGDKLTLKFDNRSGKEKHVWINYQGLVDEVGKADDSTQPSELSTEGLHLSEYYFGADQGEPMGNGLYSEATPLYIPNGSELNFFYGEGRGVEFKDNLPIGITVDSITVSEGYRADFYESPTASGNPLFSVNHKQIIYILFDSNNMEVMETEKNYILEHFFKKVAESGVVEGMTMEDAIFITSTLFNKARSFKVTKL